MMEGRSFGMRALAALLVVPLVLGSAACDSGGSTGPARVDLDVVSGSYEPATFTFDPQGAAPAGDVLAALEATGFDLELNISRVGTFQILYRDPATGEARLIEGTVEARTEAIRLVFPSQGVADQLVLPRLLTLAWDAEAQSLSFSGSAEVNRARLQQLFPELYGDEPWTTTTIPGTLTIIFKRA